MGLADDLLGIPVAPEPIHQPPAHPKGWEPGVSWSPDNGGTITTGPLVAEPDEAIWQRIIADWGIDPATTSIIPGSVQIRTWEVVAKGGEIRRLYYYRARLAPRVQGDRLDVDALCEQIMRRKPRRPPATTDGGRALVACLADWQAGKTDVDGGTPLLIERVCDAIDALADRVREQKRNGRPVDAVYLVGMGDLIESCSSSHATQLFTLDLDLREQIRVVRRLLLRAVDVVGAVAPRVVLTGVPGNHGEARTMGKMVTRPSDNHDVGVIEQVGDILAANPDRYGNVSVTLPEAYTLTLDVAGVPVSWLHGHGTTPAPKMEDWWKGQALGRTGVADSTILVTAHYHHLRISEATGRTWLQCPAMDPGSSWWSHRTGQSSPAGMLTFVAGEACGPRGWADLAVL